MKRKLHLLAFLLLLQAPVVMAQDEATSPCTTCSKYLYWTGEVNKDFFNERNWILIVQLPSSPDVPTNPQDSIFDGTSVKPFCLPGANKEPYQICLTELNKRNYRSPIPGTLTPGEPIRYNLYARNVQIDANGDIEFESDRIGFTMDGVTLNNSGNLVNGVYSISGSSTVHSQSFGSSAILNLQDNESWVYLHNENPDAVIAASSQLWMNDAVATIDGNIRVNQYYFSGSVIRGKSADYTPLTIYADASLAGSSAVLSESIIYAESGIPGGMDNRTKSFVLKRGYMATFAVNDNGTGKSKVYIASEQDLVVNELPVALQQSISFIRVLPWNWVTKKGNGGYKPGVDASWFYNWNNNQTSKANYEYAPMTWGASAALPASINQIIAKEKVTHLLGFNESDNCNDQSGQYSNLCQPEVAVAYYENLMGTGMRLGTPAPRENGPTTWLKDFNRIAKERDVRFDFVAVHWYDWGSNPANSPYEDAQKVFNRFKAYLANVYSIYGLPIWITEFNANPNRDNSVNAAFLQLALPYLEQLDYVERYAYFEPMTSLSTTGVAHSHLFNSDGSITNIGTIYKNQISTASIPEVTYASPNNLEGMNSPYVEIPTQINSLEGECTMYRGNHWEVKEDSTASNGHYLRHNKDADGTSALADQFHYEFESTQSDVLRLWVSVKTAPGTNGALKIKIDNKDFETLNNLTANDFTWLRIPRYYSVAAGKHRISISSVNDGTYIDRVALINNSNAVRLAASTDTTSCVLPTKNWGLVATDVTYWAEAETAFAGSDWKQGSDDSAIGGKFMTPSTGLTAIDTPPGTAGHLQFNFLVTDDDEYTIWGKVQALTSTSDAYWFSIDGEPFRKWNNLENKVYQWQWQKFYFTEGSTNRNFSYFLEQGPHTIVVAYSEADAKLDRIAIASTQRNPALEDPNVLLKDPVMEFEAESATLLGTPTVVTCSVASNGKLVNTTGSINNGIRFSNVGIGTAGNYRLTISYISKDTRNFKLIVNGVDLAANSNYSVAPSGNWCYETNPKTADWHKVIALNAGTNTIEIRTISSGGNTNAPFFDKISLVREYLAFEAESARFTGDVSADACSRASNGLLANLKTSTTNSISFDNVFVDEAAAYYVDIHYVSKVARSAKLIINGVSETIAFDASGNWCYEAGPSNAPKVKSLLRALANGTNKIEIKTTGADAPLIDKISILKQPVKTSSSARVADVNSIPVENIKIETVLAYPNPLKANDELTVYVPGEQEGNFEMQILDINGRQLFQNNSGKLNETTSFRPDLKNGLYILMIHDGKARHIEKLIVRD